MEVRGYSIQFASCKKKSRCNRLAAIERKVNSKKDSLINGHNIYTPDQLSDHITDLEKERNEILDYKWRGQVVRARQSWLVSGERNTKLFFNLEKQNYYEKNRQQIRLKCGKITSSNQEILKEQVCYYKELYTTKNIKIDENYLNGLNLMKISEEERNEMEQDITMSEVEKALREMELGKVCGLDGIPSEFLLHFYDDLKEILHQVTIMATTEGFLPNMARGVISLLEKPGKDQLNIACWCPLSLLNTDYKLVSKVLANRLYKVIPKITQ